MSELTTKSTTKKQPKEELSGISTARFEAFGSAPLIAHADSIPWADEMESWVKTHKGASKPGDDRTPPFRWIGCLCYEDAQTGQVCLSAEMLMKCLMMGAAEVTMKGAKTFKALSQSALVCRDYFIPLLVNGKPIQMAEVQAARTIDTFAGQMALAKDLGFELFTRRARVGENKHIRVRPKFNNWSFSTVLMIGDKRITLEVLQQICEIAGRLKGLGDWRPSAPKSPGPFGTFEAKVTAGS